MALGGMIGGFGSGASSLAQAQFTLFVSPALALALPGGGQSFAGPTQSNALDWAVGQLTSKDAVEMVCRKIERSQVERKDLALRSACLLPEGGRIETSLLSETCLRVRVRAEDPATAVVLCEGLLAYLSFRAKIPLENPEPTKLLESEKRLRLKEREIVGPGLQGPPVQLSAGVGSGLREAEFGEYQAVLLEYRGLMEESFFRETRLASGSPYFSVIEPAFVVSSPKSRSGFLFLGLVFGGLAGMGFPFFLRSVLPLVQRKSREG